MKSFSLCLGIVLCAAAAAGRALAADSDGLRGAHEKYRTCATLSLPDNFANIANPRHAAERALDLCQKKRLALAGQFALDNPGTRKTADYVDGVRVRMVADLATWITDMKSLGIQGPR